MTKAHEQEIQSFDVTCVVGTVELTDGPGMSASAQAMILIAEHDAEGVYEFPIGNGQTQRVIVEREGPARESSVR